MRRGTPFFTFKPLIPEILKRTLPSLNLNMSTDENRGFNLSNNKMVNGVEPHKTASRLI